MTVRIVGLGGSLSPHSTSLAALRVAAEAKLQPVSDAEVRVASSS
jgi:hypothetical protein